MFPRFALLVAMCRTASAHRPSGVHHSGAAYEWIGVFATNALSHTWSAQKVGGAYADPAMKLVLIETALPTEASMEKLQDLASDLMKGECPSRLAGYALRGTTAGVCYTLQFDAGLDDSLFTIDTTGVAGLVIAGEHGPTEFERDRHYLYDSSGTDIEPIAEGGDADHDISFGSHSFNMALLLSLFAGLATAVGGLVVYLPESLHGGREATLACALADTDAQRCVLPGAKCDQK